MTDAASPGDTYLTGDTDVPGNPDTTAQPDRRLPPGRAYRRPGTARAATRPPGRTRGDGAVGRAPVGLVGNATTVPIGEALGEPVVPTPPGTRWTYSLRLPAFWLLLALLAVGGVRITSIAAAAFAQFPIATAVAAGVFVLYAVPFILVVRSLDFFEREPMWLVASAAGWGALVATTTAIAGNSAARSIVAKVASPAFATAWGPAIIGPTIEEVVKTLGVVVVVLVARRQVNSVADGAVYGAFVGLGFQVVEDFVDACNAVATAGRGDSVQPVMVTFLVRGFLAGLWSHTLFSALAGAGVAYYVIHRRNRPLAQRLTVALAAIAGAWLFHFVWNSPWFTGGFGAGGFGVLAGLIVKGAPALILIVLLVRSASGREADFYLGTLVALADPRIVTTREVAALRTGRRRLAARRYAYARCGRPGARTVRQIQRAQAELALDMSRGGRHAYPLRLRVLVLRRTLDAMAHPEACEPPAARRDRAGLVVGVTLALILAVVITVALHLLGAP